MRKINKREWIKNIAIVFLVIMLILTFFSNTIMNRSLPEVSSQGITNGTIVTQVRGDGIVTAQDPYNVVVDETRKVKSVATRVDDRVEKGDVIYYLEGETSDELTKAKNDLASAMTEYDLYLIDNGISKADAEKIQSGVTTTTTVILQNLEAKDKAIADAQKVSDETQKKIDELTKQKSLNELNTVDAKAEADALNKAKDESAAADSVLAGYDAIKADYEEKSSLLAQKTAEYNWEKERFDNTDPDPAVTDPEYYAEIKAAFEEVDKAKYLLEQETASVAAKIPSDEQYNAAKADAEGKKNALANAQKNYDNKLASVENNGDSLSKQLLELNYSKSENDAKVKALQDEREAYYSNEKAKIEIEKKYQAILQQENEVKDLEAKAIGGEVTAPVAGTITSLSYTAGEKIEAGSTVAVILIDGKGYTLSFPVNEKQAKSVKVGDEVSVVNNWFYYDVNANLVAIKPDKTSQKNGKILEFSISGESVQPGQSLTLSVGQKSSNYDLIIPLSALREDNKGTFVLIVDTKSTPFGSRYIAKRVDVDVLEKDDNNAAIKAELFGYEYVITTSSKPLNNGDQIKLAE